ncbi:MAG: hypothetical protein HYU78_02380 [Rhodocyclales bacterium]|nr:hypothetical protein [Rhodocyclales bacterium]
MSRFRCTRAAHLFLAAACCHAGIATATVSESPPQDVFGLVSGKWAWSDKADQCTENPHYISFAPDRKTAYFRVKKPFEHEGKMVSEYSYTVLYSEGNTITMLVNGETRRTDYGDRVVWVLILKDPATYKWRRTDWPPSNSTPNVRRCD